jgi:sugar phosphate isomerase/epimerase
MNITFSIFPKFYRELNLDQLAGLIHETGLDATNLVVREGYWCDPASLARDVPRFVSAMDGHGIKVRFATTGYNLGELVKDSTPLQVLTDTGIHEFRMGYFDQSPNNARYAYSRARKDLELMAGLCSKHKIRAVYQVHHWTLISNASAAYHLIQGLPAEFVGIELDPGNQTFEGSEDFTKSVSLLGEHLVAYGIKDTRPVHHPERKLEPGKGWDREWCALDEGQVNWHDVVRPLAQQNWSGTFVFMPFYHEHDSSQRTPVLKREVAYLRKIVERF